MKLIDGFETQVCTRCGGSGNYSYCSMYGTTCFRCHGRKNVYTKRGQAAINYARSLRTAKASDVKVGWLVWLSDPCFGSFKAAWYEVLSISQSGSQYSTRDADGNLTWHPYTQIETRVKGLNVCSDSEVQAIPSKDKIAESRDLALAYQKTLTKSGTPMKRKMAA